LLYLIVYLSN